MFTVEQQKVIDVCVDPANSLIKVPSVAGSGKTHTLKGIAKALKVDKALYTAFNAAVIEEAKLTFPQYVECRTLHSLAYQAVAKPHKYKVETFTIEQIKEDLQPYVKRRIINEMNNFFNSAEISMSYFDTRLTKQESVIAKKYIEAMIDGEVPVTFGFLIKYLYLQMKEGVITLDYDLVMLDEAGDLSEITIEIFKLINAPKKVMVGDQYQNIYTFMNTVNGFRKLKDHGITCRLSRSFRVCQDIAVGIEYFCKNWLDKEMEFKGIEIIDRTIKQKAYISRTNSNMIKRMMDLHKSQIPYTLLRSPDDIFDLPLALIAVSSGKEPSKREHAFLVKDKQDFDKIKIKFPKLSFHAYLKELHSDDVNLVTALRLLETNSYKEIYECFKTAKDQPKKRQPIIVTTAHVSKGQTYDSVFIEEDLNLIVRKTKNKGSELSEDDMAEFNLYYVACTRARVELINATELHDTKETKK